MVLSKIDLSLKVVDVGNIPFHIYVLIHYFEGISLIYHLTFFIISCMVN